MKLNYDATMVKMVIGFIEDAPIELKEKIAKQCDRHYSMGGDWHLPHIIIDDIQGINSSDSGWYVRLFGTHCGIRFFVNNDFEYIRKPVKSEVKASYDLSSAEDKIKWSKLLLNA